MTLHLRYLLLETSLPWLQCLMQEWMAVVLIQGSNYNLDALKDEAIKSRWGSHKSLESEVKGFIHKVHEFGEKIIQIAVVAEEYLYERPTAPSSRASRS